MGRQYKLTKERCKQCQYRTVFTGCGDYGGSGFACGYCLFTNESRVFHNGDYREDYRPGYCQVYKKRTGRTRVNCKSVSEVVNE